MNFERSKQYDKQLLLDNMMGPNCIKLLEDLTKSVEITPDMRVLDLGCGRGLTSIFLAKEFGCTVYATDLWIEATENYERFKALGLEGKIVPIHADANDLPYADEYFDAMVSVDAFHYFGLSAAYMDEKLAPLIKPGGTIAVCVPGVKVDADTAPKALSPFISDEDYQTFRSKEWWTNMLGECTRFDTQAIWSPSEAMFDEVWADWLESSNEYAVRDRGFIEKNDGQYLNFVSMVGRRI